MNHYSRPPQRDSWFAPLSVDLFIKVLKVTFLHPFICWIIPLCFRAQEYPWDHPKSVASIAWAAFVTVCWMAGVINARLAFGLPREVEPSEEVIVITGGASGLGLLLAEVYGMRGANVAVLDVNEMDTGEARGVSFYKCDVTDKKALAKVAKEIEEDLGSPTVLINNAAIVTGKSILDSTFEEIDRSITTNLTAHFYTLKTFLPSLLRSPVGGTVVTVSSVIGHVGAARLADYAAAKAGLTALHKSLTAELKGTEVRTVLVEPGQLSTPMFYGVQTPSPFLAPIVEPVEIVKEIVAAVDGGCSTNVAQPFYARWIDYFSVLPIGVQALVRKWARVDEAMNTFVGREGMKVEMKEGKGGLI